MPDDQPPADPRPSGPARRRGPESTRAWLRDALFTAPSRGQYLVAVLLVVLGFGLATQIRLVEGDRDFSGQRREELVQLLDLYSAARERADRQIDGLQQTRDELQSNSTRRQAALHEQRSRLRALGILSGAVPAHGPGITLTIDDPSGQLSAGTMLNVIMELRDAGAEAIEVNDTARVVASSYVTDGGAGELVIGGATLRPPYVIDAVGDSQTLEVAVYFRGGIADAVSASGGSASVEVREDVRVESLHDVESPAYARPDD